MNEIDRYSKKQYGRQQQMSIGRVKFSRGIFDKKKWKNNQQNIIFHMYRPLLFIIGLLASIPVNASCPDNCADCDQSGTICFACKDGLQADVFGGCHDSTISRCIIYGPTDQCFNCQPTYKLTNNLCEKDYTGCVLSNTNDGSCFECGFSTSLHGTHCSGVVNCRQPSALCSQCRAGYELRNNLCWDISEGCLEVRQTDGICGVCKRGYEFVGFECVAKKIRVPRCYIYDGQGKCLVCKNGYNIFEFRCLLSIQIQEYMMAQAQGIADDFGFTSKGFVKGGKEIEIAFAHQLQVEFLKEIGQFKQINTSQIGFSSQIQHSIVEDSRFFNAEQKQIEVLPPSHCQVPNPSDPSTCLICQYGYFPKNKYCKLVSPLCEGHNVQTGQCFDCKYGLTLNKGICIDENCAVSQDDQCLQCKNGFQPDEQKVCKYSDPNCIESFNSRCDRCVEQFYVNLEGRCKPLPPNCKIANFQTGQCLECKPEFNLNPQLKTCENIPVIKNCQVPNPENPSICLICNYGWYPSQNQCLKVSSLCNQHNVQNGKCLNCKNEYLKVEEGKCIDANCRTYDEQTCVSCKPNHKFNEKKGICEFEDVNCEKSVDISCIICKPGFYVNQKKTCSPLPDNCQAATPIGECSECCHGFQLGNGRCFQIITIQNCAQVDSVNKKCIFCNDRYYTKAHGCSHVPEECHSYDPLTGECLKCKIGYILQFGKCVLKKQNKEKIKGNENEKEKEQQKEKQQYIKQQKQQQKHEKKGKQEQQLTVRIDDRNCRKVENNRCTKCSKHFYLDENNKCIPVNPLCRDHNDKGQCTQCYQGYTVSDGRCIVSVISDPNCEEFASSHCVKCYKGYYLHSFEQICKRVNPLCQSYDPGNGACKSCYPGYNLNVNRGSCEVFFRDPNCKNFNSQNKCLSCANRYYINQSGKCSSVSPLCKGYNQENGKCTDCYPGYAESDGKCVLGAAKDPNCRKFSGNQCVECFRSYFVRNGQCKKVNPLCKDFDKSNGDCTDCFPGYSLKKGRCVEGVSRDANCKTFDAENKCIKCYGGFLPIKGHCQQQNSLCHTINYSNGDCESCWPGFSLVDGNCVVKSQQSSKPSALNDIYCIQAKDDKCLKCANGYYPNKQQNICKQVNTLCKKYNPDDGCCTACYPGFQLGGGTCQKVKAAAILYCVVASPGGKCTECMQGYYVSDGQCKPVSILCASYDPANGRCTSCGVGHHLQDGQCIFPALFDARCAWYESAYCIRCQNGFYMQSYTCHPIDGNCAYFNQDLNLCEECVNGLTPYGSDCI